MTRWPAALITADTPRKASGAWRPPTSGMSAKKPRGSVITRFQVLGNPSSAAAPSNSRVDDMVEPYRRRPGPRSSWAWRGGGKGSRRRPPFPPGAAKGVRGMAEAAGGAAGPGLRGGIVIVPHGSDLSPIGGVTVAAGAHPVPDATGEAATRRTLEAVAAAGRSTLVLVVLAGGASALLVAPAPGLDLCDKQEVTRGLLLVGADIEALNTVRKHCSQVKGGGLLRAAAGAAGVWTLVLSDVVGDDPATIGSGPTVPDPTTFADAARV